MKPFSYRGRPARQSLMGMFGICIILLILCGCNDPKSFGVGPWPIYAEPPPLTFTPEEAAELQSIARGHPALFQRIQAQEHAYRAILEEHNRRAKEMNQRQLKALGFDEKSLKDTLSP